MSFVLLLLPLLLSCHAIHQQMRTDRAKACMTETDKARKRQHTRSTLTVAHQR